jgi:hypothetical protein
LKVLSAEPHEANLFDLQAKYAEVISLDSALAYLADFAGMAASEL